MGAEDFSFYQDKIPGLYSLWVALPKENQFQKQHHTIFRFYIDESGFVLGVKTMANLTVDYMEMQYKK
jgi:metal-dependent amidase/aminoacylase/carboxypeptidase family protein